MNPQERIEAFWAGEKPSQIPYTMYWWDWRLIADDPDWQPMFRNGLRVTYQMCTVKSQSKNVEYSETPFTENGRKYIRKTMNTPVGKIFSILEDNWTQVYWLKTPDDYKVMKYIVENTQLSPDYEVFEIKREEVADHGIVHAMVGDRSPLQSILVDFAGLENFAYHLIDYESEVMELYYALLKNFRKRVEIVAEGPGHYVGVLENFTADALGPERFKEFHIPVYEELYPILHSSGKIVGNHFDGKLASCKELVAQSPIDVIESLTPPPEGDMILAECRAVWPKKLFWSNINLETYYLEPKILKETILNSIEQASPDGKRLAFEISETIPENWKVSIPLVMEALQETSNC